MKIFIGADHNGFELKQKLYAQLLDTGHTVVDMGDLKQNKDDDFPVYAARVAAEVRATENSFGILLCGSGQGVCMAANRFSGIRAALCWSEESAFEARHDDDANILCLPAELISHNDARDILNVWLETNFANAARYRRRNAQLDQLV